MMKMISKLYNKYKEVILYVVFGVLTTLVNFGAFWIFTKILGENLYLINNAIAWIIAVIFAYITNKLWVFDSKSFKFKVLIKEFTSFVVARLFSFGVEELGIWLFVDILSFGERSFNIFNLTISGQMIAKVFLAVIVVIMNYFFSKFIIFAKKKDNKKA